jgi:outer membrane protein
MAATFNPSAELSKVQLLSKKIKQSPWRRSQSTDMMRLLLLALMAAVFAAAADQPTLPAELTLPQALDIALRNSTNIRTAMAQLDQASGRYEQARSPLLPQLNVGARQGYLTVNLPGIGIELPSANGENGLLGLIGPFASMNASAFLSQQVLNLAEWRAWKSSRFRQDSFRLLVDNARELVALRVVATYLDALKAKATRNTLTEQRKLAEELYRLTRDRVTKGVSAELDANRAMQKVNTLEQQRQEAEHTYIATKLSLANILQARVTSEFDVADNAAYGAGTGPDRDMCMKSALTLRPDYRSAEASVNAADLQVRSVKATRLPTIQMQFDDGQSGNTPAHNVNTYRLQGSIDVPIYTGGRIQGEIAEAEGALREARAALDEIRSQIETDVLTALSAEEWALKEVETSAGNVKLSRQEVEFTRSRFTQGISDNTEVVNAQDRLEKADEASIRAQYMLGLARANLARATGAAEKTYRK